MCYQAELDIAIDVCPDLNEYFTFQLVFYLKLKTKAKTFEPGKQFFYL